MNFNLLNQALEERRQENLYRERWLYDDKNYLSFCSNDYLGLSQHPKVIQSFKNAADQYGVGSGASHLIAGYKHSHAELEEAFADWMGYERALLFGNGYMANLGVLSALPTASDFIYQDKNNHASLIDAGEFSKATSRRYLHANCLSLEKHLEKEKTGQRFIVTDGVFSMSGAIAPILNLTKLAVQYAGTLIVDDAHGIGVLGKTGRGSLEHHQLSSKNIPILIAPLGKAFGGYGALVASNHTVIETIIQSARSYIYTTALPPALASSALCSLELIKTETWRRERLSHLITFFKTEARARNLTLWDSETPIQALIIGDSSRAIRLSERLYAQGILVRALRPPSVTTATLRITLSALHTEAEILNLLDNIQREEKLL